MSVSNSATLLYHHHHQHQHQQQQQQQQHQQHHSVASTPTNGTLSQSHHYQHQHQHHQQPQQQPPDDRQQGGGGGAGRRSSSRGQQAPPPTAGDAAAAAVTSDGRATPPPPPPVDAAMDGNDGEDGRREETGRREEDGKREEYHGPRLLPLTMTTQEVVTYLDDNEDFTTETELLIDRDPFRWHEGIVKVKFDDIFGEPDSEIFSFDSVWKLSSKVYKTTKLWCYRLLSVVFVVPLVVVWGVVFSCLSFSRIWVCVPLLKAADIQLHCLRRLIEALLRTFLAPCFEAVGRCLYHIRLRIIRGDESSL